MSAGRGGQAVFRVDGLADAFDLCFDHAAKRGKARLAYAVIDDGAELPARLGRIQILDHSAHRVAIGVHDPYVIAP